MCWVEYLAGNVPRGYKTLAIGAYFEKVKDTYVLKLALSLKRREWFTVLWNHAKAFSPPVTYFIA